MSDRTVHRVRIVNPRLKPDALPRVTSHALLRYAERMLGFDVKKATLELSGPEVQKAILHGADAVVVGNLKVALKRNAVVTVLGKTHQFKPTNKVLRSFQDLREFA